jgi:integrase
MIWRRIQKRSGVKRLGSHLIRHSSGQGMARAGALIADIQDVLDHESDKMARHYPGEGRKPSGPTGSFRPTGCAATLWVAPSGLLG